MFTSFIRNNNKGHAMANVLKSCQYQHNVSPNNGRYSFLMWILFYQLHRLHRYERTKNMKWKCNLIIRDDFVFSSLSFASTWCEIWDGSICKGSINCSIEGFCNRKLTSFHQLKLIRTVQRRIGTEQKINRKSS